MLRVFVSYPASLGSYLSSCQKNLPRLSLCILRGVFGGYYRFKITIGAKSIVKSIHTYIKDFYRGRSRPFLIGVLAAVATCEAVTIVVAATTIPIAAAVVSASTAAAAVTMTSLQSVLFQNGNVAHLRGTGCSYQQLLVPQHAIKNNTSR